MTHFSHSNRGWDYLSNVLLCHGKKSSKTGVYGQSVHLESLASKKLGTTAIMQHWNFSLTSETISVRYCICWIYSYTVLWTFSKALEAKLMFFRTSVLVCEFSKASLWNSMVESVPSIWASCCSRRFFLFRASRAADTKKMKSCSLAPFVLIWLKPLGLGIQKQQIQVPPQCLF